MHRDQSAQAPPQHERLSGDDGREVVCPVPCDVCRLDGDCEDCLDCLYWPEVLDSTPLPASPAPGPMAPVRTGELEAARARLDIAARIGLVVRRFRRQQLLSQRSLAARLGWHHSTVARVEADAAALTIGKAERLLRLAGHRLAIVPVTVDVAAALREDPDKVWGAPDLLAKDGRGRRLPPYGQVTWHSVLDRRLYARLVGHEAEWTWHRPRPDNGQHAV